MITAGGTIAMTQYQIECRCFEAELMHNYGRALLSVDCGLYGDQMRSALVGNPDQKIIIEVVD
jgi:hypothetical protein